MLPALLGQIPPEEPVETVGADGAYDTKACHAAIANRGATALIPVRKNAQPWKDSGAGARARNEILRTTQRLGRTIWKKWSGYHRRSLVETKMRCFKLLSDGILTGRWQSCRFVQLCSIVSPNSKRL
ncbi:MAG: family transposase [Proteobacteria bacterium]|nr:family transposase [Pseudomonadota bacterium]